MSYSFFFPSSSSSSSSPTLLPLSSDTSLPLKSSFKEHNLPPPPDTELTSHLFNKALIDKCRTFWFFLAVSDTVTHTCTFTATASYNTPVNSLSLGCKLREILLCVWSGTVSVCVCACLRESSQMKDRHRRFQAVWLSVNVVSGALIWSDSEVTGGEISR